MAVYEPDSSATAVILCKLTDISYKWGIESFRLVSEYKVKIKVLKPEGTSYADVIIPYYELPNNAMKENIIGLDASAYNLENEERCSFQGACGRKPDEPEILHSAGESRNADRV